VLLWIYRLTRAIDTDVAIRSSVRSRGTGGVGGGQAVEAGISSLSVHSTQRHLCASSGSEGSAALWDLRFSNAPVAFTAPLQGTARPLGGTTEVTLRYQCKLAEPIANCKLLGRLEWTTFVFG
jgi:hypothetical protein